MGHPKLSILIPAAGTSERLGHAKQLVKLGGTALIQNAVNIAQSIGPYEILVVTGANAKAVKDAVPHPPVRWVHNPDWLSGMGGSIALGAAETCPESTGLMVLLCDQWRVQEKDLRTLAETWQTDPGRIVCAHSNGINMPPVIFPSGCLDGLRKLKGHQGARNLLKEHADLLIPVSIKNATFDLDTPTQLGEMGSEGEMGEMGSE